MTSRCAEGHEREYKVGRDSADPKGIVGRMHVQRRSIQDFRRADRFRSVPLQSMTARHLPLNIGFLPLPVDPSQMAMTRSLRSTARPSG